LRCTGIRIDEQIMSGRRPTRGLNPRVREAVGARRSWLDASLNPFHIVIVRAIVRTGMGG